MPYAVRKQDCTRSDGKKGKYVLKYKPKKPTKKKKDSEGYVRAGCHTSKKNANSQRAAIEGGPRESKDQIDFTIGDNFMISERDLRVMIREVLESAAIKANRLTEQEEENLSNADFTKGLKTGAADLAASIPAKLNDDFALMMKSLAAMAEHDRSKFDKIKGLIATHAENALAKEEKGAKPASE